MKKLPVFLLFLGMGLGASGQVIRELPYMPGDGFTFETPGKYRVEFSGLLQPMSETRWYPDMEQEKALTRFRMRRMIGKFRGRAVEDKINWQVQVDFTGSSDGGADAGTNNYLMDAWVSWRIKPGTELTFGQDNSPTDSRELSMLSGALQMVERSQPALAFSSIREFGLFFNTRIKTGRSSLLQPAFAITNGDGANVLTKDRGGLKFGARLDFLPFGSFSNSGMFEQVDMDRERTPKLVIGAHYSYNQGISDRRGRQSGTILYLDSMGKELLPDYQKFGIDFLFKYRGFSMFGEYVNADATVPTGIRQRVRSDGSTSTSFDVNGVQNMPAYVKGRIILGSGLNLQAGYLFKNRISIDGRYSKMMPQANSFLRNPSFYNRSSYYSLCLSHYLARNFGAKIQAMFTYAVAEPGSETLSGKTMVGNEFSGLLMITFAL